jgi:hypothetical protein
MPVWQTKPATGSTIQVLVSGAAFYIFHVFLLILRLFLLKKTNASDSKKQIRGF